MSFFFSFRINIILLDLLNKNNYKDFDAEESKSIYHCLLLLHLQISKDQILSFARFLLSFECQGVSLKCSFSSACLCFLLGNNLSLSAQGVLGV